MAARAYWQGQIRLALVSIPVEICTATKSGAQIVFHQIHEPGGKRIKYEKVVPGIGEVDPDEPSKGMNSTRAITSCSIKEEGGSLEPCLYIEDADGLIVCVQMGAIEFRGWGSSLDRCCPISGALLSQERAMSKNLHIADLQPK